MNVRSLLTAAAVAVIFSATTAAGASGTTTSSHGSRYSAPSGAVDSGGGSGYVVTAASKVALRFVGADWTVPSFNATKCSPGTSGSAYAYERVALDGWFGGNTEEQTGTGAYCHAAGGPVTYFAYYEMYPDPPVTFTAAVSPGDAITASVYYNSTTHLYNLLLTDVTQQDQIINVNVACPVGQVCQNRTAEAITGFVASFPPQVNQADYGMANYTAASVTSRDGFRGTLAASKYWVSAQINMVDNNGNHMATTSPLYGGQAFNSTWNAAS